MRDVAEWLRHTPISSAIWSALWFIRLLQATHLLTAGVACVSGLVIALRSLGWLFAAEPFDAIWRRFAPCLWWSFVIMLATGIAQSLGDPVREFTSTSYWLKLALVLCCMTGTLLLGRRLRGAAHTQPAPVILKLLAAGLILCWLMIPLLGRMIAYDKAFWGSLSLRA